MSTKGKLTIGIGMEDVGTIEVTDDRQVITKMRPVKALMGLEYGLIVQGEPERLDLTKIAGPDFTFLENWANDSYEEGYALYVDQNDDHLIEVKNSLGWELVLVHLGADDTKSFPADSYNALTPISLGTPETTYAGGGILWVNRPELMAWQMPEADQ